MTAVALRVRSDARRRWRAWISVALLIGVGAGAAMALAQGARRTRGAYPRFADAQHAADIVVTGKSSFGLVGAVDLDQVEQMPAVATSARAFVGLPFTGTLDDGRTIDASDVFPVAALDNRLGHDVENWKLLTGRRAAPDRADEAVASFELADRLHLHVGSEIDFRFYAADHFTATAAHLVASWPQRLAARHAAGAAPSTGADGPSVHIRVVGIESSPAEFPPMITDLAPVLHLTPAFANRYRTTIVGSDLAYVRLQPGARLAGFQVAVERLSGGQPVSFVETRTTQTQKVQRSIDVEANVLTVVAALVALAAALAIAQALARQTYADRRDDATLRALGMDDRQLRAAVLVRALVIAAAGAVLAGGFAVFASPVVLLPLARHASLDSGPQVDALVLASGALAVLALASIVAWWTGRPAHRRGAEARRRTRPRGPGIVRPLTAGLGVRFATGRVDAPALGAVLGVAASAAIFVGAFTFTGNLDRQLDDRHRYGLNWDQKVGAPGLPDVSTVLAPALTDDREVEGLALGTVTTIHINGQRVDVLAIDQLKGMTEPTLVAGRPPETPDEVVLGARTRRRLGVTLGDTVRVEIGKAEHDFQVVGQGVFPEFGDAGQLGTGAYMTFDGVHRLLPTAPRNTYLVRYADRSAVDHERKLVASAVVPYPTRADARPQDLVDLARGDGLLGFLSVALALLALAVLVHALVTTTRNARRDFAVLRALGLLRHQVWWTIAWQVAAIVGGALLIGIPLGLAVGQLAWARFAMSLGIASDAVVPAGSLVLAVGGAAVVAALAALVPALLAARNRPAPVLRTA